jgi:hypothetical protein
LLFRRQLELVFALVALKQRTGRQEKHDLEEAGFRFSRPASRFSGGYSIGSILSTG